MDTIKYNLTWVSTTVQVTIQMINRKIKVTITKRLQPDTQLDGCIVWNAHNTVLDSKRSVPSYTAW